MLQQFGVSEKLNETKSTGSLRESCVTVSMELELGQTRKMSKFDSLKPILTLLENLLVREGLSQHQADMVVLDIAERLVTAGYGWDKILQYQSKVDFESLTSDFHLTAGRTSV